MMFVLDAMVITDDMLLQSDAPEPGPGEVPWLASTAYVLKQRVLRQTTHRIYECLVAGVDAGLPETTPVRWLDVGPSNQRAMFDLSRNTATVGGSVRTFVVRPGRNIDSVALLGLVATSVTLTLVSNGVTVFNQTRNLNKRVVQNLYDYRFKPLRFQRETVFLDLPMALDIVYTVTVRSADAIMQIGALIFSLKEALGVVQSGARVTRRNQTQVEYDADGVAQLKPARPVPAKGVTLLMPGGWIDRVVGVLDSLHGRVACWVGIDDHDHAYYSTLITLGFYTRLDYIYEQADDSTVESVTLTIDLEEF